MPVSYLREGRVRQAQLTLGRARGEGSLVPRVFDRGADYYVYGGLAFLSLTRNLLDMAKDWVPAPIAALAREEPDHERDEVVLLVAILSSDVNSGYSDERWQVVSGVNGRKTRNLRELVRGRSAAGRALRLVRPVERIQGDGRSESGVGLGGRGRWRDTGWRRIAPLAWGHCWRRRP